MMKCQTELKWSTGSRRLEQLSDDVSGMYFVAFARVEIAQRGIFTAAEQIWHFCQTPSSAPLDRRIIIMKQPELHRLSAAVLLHGG